MHALDLAPEQPHLGVTSAAVEAVIALIQCLVHFVGRAARSSVAFSFFDFFSFLNKTVSVSLKVGRGVSLGLDESLDSILLFRGVFTS